MDKFVDLVKEKFDDVVVIRVNRINFESELTKAQQQHKIENAMNEYKDYDYILTNDTLEKLEDYTITAPITGTVVTKNTKQGDK